MQPQTQPQSYANHSRLVTGYHGVLFGLLAVILMGACVDMYHTVKRGDSSYDAALILTLSVAVMLAAYYARVFALKAQDRAIRAEENLRYYVLTGSLLDRRLHTRQIVALRFASDEELPALVQRTLTEGLAPKQIKQAITSWRADHYRV